MARRKSTGGTAYTGDVFPPPPAIPEPQKTEAEIARKREQKAKIVGLLREIREHQIETNLSRAVVLVQMAYRRQGPLVAFFAELGFKYADLADAGPRRPGPELRVVQGGGD